MPEIGEVARVVHFLRKHLASRRIANILTTDDQLVFNTKVGTTPSGFAEALKGKKVLDARQQGKYFWLEMDSPPHPLMHLGMNGWVKMNCEDTRYISGREGEAAEEEEEEDEQEEEKDAEGGGRPVAGEGKGKWKGRGKEQGWPPKYWKFVLQMEGEPKVEAAFTDSRRLARIRLVDCPADQMRLTTPLKENGPDPVQDKHILTEEWLGQRMSKKKVPIKALLLDQANISGVGNWVADEVLYNARIHPEQYSNTFSDAQVKQLHKSLMYVCGLACELLADSSKFPKEWLFKHRWGKGRKLEKNMVLPNGEKFVHITVGGRTSAVVPSVQKKTGPVAGDVDQNAVDGEVGDAKKKTKAKGGKKRKAKEISEDEEDEGNDEDEEQEEEEEEVVVPKKKSRASSTAGKAKKPAAKKRADEEPPAPVTKAKKSKVETEETKPSPKARKAVSASSKTNGTLKANGVKKGKVQPSKATQADTPRRQSSRLKK